MKGEPRAMIAAGDICGVGFAYMRHSYGQGMMNMSLKNALKTPAFDEPTSPLMNKARTQKDTYGFPCEP